MEMNEQEMHFRNGLQELLNRCCMENGSNTPDWQLADYLIACLRALDETINQRSSFYHRFDSPGNGGDVTANAGIHRTAEGRPVE